MTNLLPIVAGIILGIFTIIFLFYGALSVRHAARFRYLSKRTVYLTIFFVCTSTVLLVLCYIAYGMILFNPD